MSEMTLDELYRAVSQLPPEQQQELIERLQAQREAMVQVQPELNLLVFDVGPWPEDLLLRREDVYGDDKRGGSAETGVRLP